MCAASVCSRISDRVTRSRAHAAHPKSRALPTRSTDRLVDSEPRLKDFFFYNLVDVETTFLGLIEWMPFRCDDCLGMVYTPLYMLPVDLHSADFSLCE